MGLNSSETLGPRHSKARPKGWAYNRVSTVPSTLNSKPTPGGREFSEKAVAPDWDKNPVLTVLV